MSDIHIEIHGEGQPLIMLHGWAMHSGVWRPFAQQLAQHYRVFCLDLPGHGRSQAPESFDLASAAQAVLQVIPEQQFAVLGWSLGATLALAMAEQAPQRISRLIVLAGNPHFLRSDDWPGVEAETLDGFAELLKADVRQTLTRFLALQVNGLAHGRQLLQTLKQALQECSAPEAEVLQAGLRMLKESDMRDAMLRSDVPIKMIMGNRDTLVPLASADRLQQLKPSVELQVLEGAGHAPFLSHPQQLLAAIRDFYD